MLQMIDKEYVLQLLQMHCTFIAYETNNNYIVYFTWDEKEQVYEEYKNKYDKDVSEILQIIITGRTIETYLKYCTDILMESIDGEIENEIVSNYIRKDYRERCRYLLTGKKRKRFVDLVQQNKKTLNMKRAEKLEALYNLQPQLPEEWYRKKIGDKQGYLLTGYIHSYKGKMDQLLEYMLEFETFSMGILYCPEAKRGIMQFDCETMDGRWYWLM